MGELTTEIPKPMLTVNGKTLLEIKIDQLPASVKSVVLVVGYRQSVIEQFFGNQYKSRTIEYAVQEELNGTASALHTAKDLLDGRFLVLMGDDLYSKESIEKLVECDRGLLAYAVSSRRSGAKVISSVNNQLIRIDEYGTLEKGDLINTAAYLLDTDFFSLPKVSLPNGEYGLPQTVAAATASYPVSVVTADRWMQITSPDDLALAESIV